MIWALVVVPLLAGFGAGGLRGPHRRRSLAVITVGGLAVTAAVGAWAGATRPTGSLRWSPGLALQLEVSGLGRIMAVLVPTVALAVVVFALASERADPHLNRLVALLTGFVGAMELLVAAGDFLTLLIAWEAVGACSWALIGHRWREPGVSANANAAFLITRVGDAGLYLAAAGTFAGSGSFSFSTLATSGWRLDLVAAGLLIAAAAKSAQLPFSPWLFSAMAGPTPASALLHSATMVAAGAYVLARLAPQFAVLGWFGPAVVALGLATALAGGVVASLQGDLKRALAASTSAQYGLMLVAIGAGSSAAAGAHLLNHALFKSLLFLGAGVAIHAAGTGQLTRMRTAAHHRSHRVMFGLGVLALAAVPPLGAAASKEAIVASVLSASGRSLNLGGARLWVWWGVLTAGALSAFYAVRLQRLVFGAGERAGSEQPRSSAGRPELMAMAGLAGLTVVSSAMWLPAGRRLLEGVLGARIPDGGIAGLVASVATVAVGGGLAMLADHRGQLLDLGLAPARQRAAADWLGLPELARMAVVNPVLALAARLAALDDRVVDAGVRATAQVASATSRALSWWGERSFDGVVSAVAGSALVLARSSRAVDERAVDAAVENLAGGVAIAGRTSRRLQSGLSHQYFLILAVGLVILMGALALGGR